MKPKEQGMSWSSKLVVLAWLRIPVYSQRGFMTKQGKAAMAAMLMVSALPMAAQQSQTDVVKVAPGQKKTTTIQRRNGATDTVVSEGVSSGGTHKRKTRSAQGSGGERGGSRAS